MDTEGLAESLVRLASAPLRIAVSGWPAVGKTTVSQQIALGLSDALHIQAESWLHSIDYREARTLSGSSLRAYSVSTAIDELDQLLLKHESVQLGEYQHHAGRIVLRTEVSRRDDAPYILDGTLFCAPAFQHLVEMCFFIYPRNHDEWLEVAVRRDVEVRGFSLSNARAKNAAKREDMIALEKKSTHLRRVQWTVLVDGSFRYGLHGTEAA